MCVPGTWHLDFQSYSQLLLKTHEEEGRSQGPSPLRSAELGGLTTTLPGAVSLPPRPRPLSLQGRPVSDSKAATSMFTLKDEEGLTNSFGPNFLSSGSQGPVAFVRSLLRFEHLLGTFLAPGWELGSGGGEMTGSLGLGTPDTEVCAVRAPRHPSGSAPKSPLPGSLPGSHLGHTPCPLCVLRALHLLIALLIVMILWRPAVLPSLLRALEGWASTSSGLSWPSCPQGLALSRCSING